AAAAVAAAGESSASRRTERADRCAADSRTVSGGNQGAGAAGTDAGRRAEEVRAGRVDYLQRDSGAHESDTIAGAGSRGVGRLQQGPRRVGARDRTAPQREQCFAGRGGEGRGGASTERDSAGGPIALSGRCQK